MVVETAGLNSLCTSWCSAVATTSLLWRPSLCWLLACCARRPVGWATPKSPNPSTQLIAGRSAASAQRTPSWRSCSSSPLQPRRLHQPQDRQYTRRRVDTNTILQKRQKRAAMNNDVIDYYTDGVTNLDVYIDSAFRSTRQNKVYLFMGNEYVLLDYAPVTKKDRVIQGPLFISNGFGSLVGTAFAEYGIDAAFGCHGLSEAFIFSGNLSAKINYAPGSTNDEIVEGPKTIKRMFPFFEGTNFEKGIDAGFESTRTGEAYLFKGAEYALFNYSERTLIAKGKITEGFSCLRETMFASDIGAAFASHRDNEAYLFKDNNYVQLYFTPGEKRDYIIGGPKEIVPSNWPSLKDILPRKNSGLDICESDEPDSEPDQDD